jgi:hypothetical protein
MGADRSLQGMLQLCILAAQAGLGQLGQLGGTLPTLRQRPQHGSTADPHHVAGHVPELDALQALRAEVDRLAAEDVHQLSDAAPGEDLVELQGLIDRLEAQYVRQVGAFDRKQGCAASGALSTGSWLRSNCRVSGPTAAEQVRVAHHLVELTVTSWIGASCRRPAGRSHT